MLLLVRLKQSDRFSQVGAFYLYIKMSCFRQDIIVTAEGPMAGPWQADGIVAKAFQTLSKGCRLL